MILRSHIPFFEEILKIENFAQDPVLTFGYHWIEQDPAPGSNPPAQRLRRFVAQRGKGRRIARLVKRIVMPPPVLPEGFKYTSLRELLHAAGHQVTTLDLFDSRADLQYDMNQPVPESEHEKYGTIIDIGCLEHLFDTAQCLENCIRMLRPGGHYLLHTPVNGYFQHGLHVFNPQGLVDCFTANGLTLVYLKYSTSGGKPIVDPGRSANSIIWMVGRKDSHVRAFTCPQQRVWNTFYDRVNALNAVSTK